VTNLETPSRAVVRFYNKRGTAEQWIKEGKQAVKMTRLSCHRFRSNQVRLALSLLAYNLGNLWRRLALPKRIENWSLTSLQQRLVKTGGRLVKHARYYWLLLAESHLTRRLLGVWCGGSRCRRFRRIAEAWPEIDPESRGDGGVSHKTGWECLGQQFWNLGWGMRTLCRAWGPAPKGKWCAGSLKGCIVWGCWEPKRKFRLAPSLRSLDLSFVTTSYLPAPTTDSIVVTIAKAIFFNDWVGNA